MYPEEEKNSKHSLSRKAAEAKIRLSKDMPKWFLTM